jgi:DHA1 family multidrug resistance protein-like MFS transporter
VRDRSFIALLALILVNQIGFGIITPVLPSYARSFGLDPADIGLVIGIYGFARFIANVPAGYLSDRRGRRQVLVIGTAITSVASALIASADSLPQLLAYRLLAGLGAATVITAGQIMVGDLATPENRGRLMSIYQGVFLFGVGLGPTPGGLLADYFGLRAPFIAYAAFSAGACVLALLLIRETKPATPATSDEADRRSPAEAHAAAVAATAVDRAVLLRTLSSRAFILIVFVSFAQFVGRTGALFTVAPLLGTEDIGLSSSQIGYALTLVNALNIMTIYFSGAFADRFGRKRVIVPAMLVEGIGLALFAYSGSYPLFLLSAATWGFGSGISGPAPAAYVTDLAPSEVRARVFGYFRSLSDAGYIVGPLALGWIATRWGYDAPLLLTAGMILLAGALFAVFAPEFHRARRAPAA